jgi:ribosomal protein L40E
MFCSKCGAKNHDDATRCIICGTALARPPEAAAAAGAPPTAPAPGQPVAVSAPPSGAGVPPAPVAAAQIATYLVPAILTTLFCCMPFGVVAIVYAAQVQTKLQAGDVAGAMKSSQSAKTWCWVSFGIGLAVGLLYLIAVIAGAASEM